MATRKRVEAEGSKEGEEGVVGISPPRRYASAQIRPMMATGTETHQKGVLSEFHGYLPAVSIDEQIATTKEPPIKFTHSMQQ